MMASSPQRTQSCDVELIRCLQLAHCVVSQECNDSSAIG